MISQPVQAPILIPSDSEDEQKSENESSFTDLATCVLKCKHVQGCSPEQRSATCASKCKHIANCPREKPIEKCSCKRIFECAQEQIGTHAVRSEHDSECYLCKCASHCNHVPDCPSRRAFDKCALISKLHKNNTQSQPTPSCASKCNHVPECSPGHTVGISGLKCIHVQDCEQGQKRDICVSKCKHSPDCIRATCTAKCVHVKDCPQSRSIACALRCNHVPECTPGHAVGICGLKCIHAQDCTNTKKRDSCVSKCKHTPDCNRTICAVKCEHVKDCSQSIASCATKCNHVQNQEKATCSSKCKHVTECLNKALSKLKCIHVDDCTQQSTCASKSKNFQCSAQSKCAPTCTHAQDCTHSEDRGKCTLICKHVPDCVQSEFIGTRATKCIHVKDCVAAQPKATRTCAGKSKHVNIQIPADERPLGDESGGSSTSGLGNLLVGKCARALESLSAITLSKSSPKIKVEPKSVSFDIDVKESVGTSSAADSPSGSCASARAHYYQSKLLSTLQVLQNKEETVRVQAESLAVAESRIACLTARGAELKRELERKGRQLQALRKALDETRLEKVDVSTTAHLQDMENQENVVKTLQINLSVIEDLYRECFYETVKQENLIDMLRKSYFDVRLVEREKSSQITKLHNVINVQKWSLDKCEDIATEVDNLKTEISNFLSSSNNDSGMWEDSFAGGLNEDLQDIAAQLLKLRDLLTGDCTCGLEDENSRLKQDNEVLEIEVGDLRIRITELEVNLVNTETLNKRQQEQLEDKDKEVKLAQHSEHMLNCIREQLTSMEQISKELKSSNDVLTCQLTRTQVLLNDKCSELSKAQEQCESFEETIRAMREELDKTDQLTKENLSLRKELCGISRRASRLQRRVDSLEEELACARAQCEHVEACYRDAAASAAELEAQMEIAQRRGAELCAEARRVVRGVRGWLRRVKDVHREQEEQMKQKECEMRCLKQALEQRENDLSSKICQSEKYCSGHPSANTLLIRERQRCPATTSPSEMAPTCSKRLQINEGSFTSNCDCGRERRDPVPCTSASEIASCASTPVPPKRTLRKKPSPCVIRRRYGWWGPFEKQQCEASVQLPQRCHVATCCDVTPTLRDVTPTLRDVTPTLRDVTPTLRDVTRPARPQRHGRPAPMRPQSPGEELFSRLESMSSALADGYRRWTRDRRDST